MFTPASAEVMLCGEASLLSIFSSTGSPALTLNSVIEKASCSLPSGPFLTDPSMLNSIVLAGAAGLLAALAVVLAAATGATAVVTVLLLLCTSATVDITSAAKTAMPPRIPRTILLSRSMTSSNWTWSVTGGVVPLPVGGG